MYIFLYKTTCFQIKFHNDQLEESLIELEKSISLASTYESHMLRGENKL